jgi:hypothetical protein
MLRHGPQLLLSLLVAAVIAACNEDAELPAGSETATPVAPSLTSVTPTGPPTTPAGKLIFLRDQPDPNYLHGAIWISDLDGSNARQVSPAGVNASYIGNRRSEANGFLIYYAIQDGTGTTTLYSAALDSGENTVALTYPDTPDYYSAHISPDGRYLVHTTPLSLDMYDFATGQTVTLFTWGSGPDCLANVFEQCYRAVSPEWSPDGRLLKVIHTVYEGGWAEVVDPFASPVAVLTEGNRSYPHNGTWSPGSDALCAQGIGLAELSGLYLLEHPDWEARNLFPEFEDWTINPDSRQVLFCDWLNENEVAFATVAELPETRGEVWLYDRATGQSRLITTIPEANGCCGGSIAAVPESDWVITQGLRHTSTDFVRTQPTVVDVRTGGKRHILREGDLILDAIPSHQQR